MYNEDDIINIMANSYNTTYDDIIKYYNRLRYKYYE
jgi:hypothetical protein